MKRIAIGGTKGKSTIVWILEYSLLNILKEVKILTISSTEGVHLNRSIIKNTEPKDYLNILDYYGNEIKHDYLITEAISSQLQAGKYIDHYPNIAVYTGIEMYEHLEVHQTFNKYLIAKKRLYDSLKKEAVAIVNGDDAHFPFMIKDTKATVITYGFSENLDYKIVIDSINESMMTFTVFWKNVNITFQSRILGDFNAMNLTAAFIALKNLSINNDYIQKAFQEFPGTPGRFQKFTMKRNIFIIDYAHTPKSLENTLKLIKYIYKDKNITTIFGCGGNKSKEKRQMMGQVASRLSGFVVLTNDNPRTENPMHIIKDIVGGIKTKNFKIIPDRRKAIKYIIDNYPNSVTLLAGKGNEKYISYASWHETIICKKCGHKMKYKLENPKLKIMNYSDLGYLFLLAQKKGLTEYLRMGDYLCTFSEALQKILYLHYYYIFHKDIVTKKIYLSLEPDFKIEITSSIYSILLKLDPKKKVIDIFQDLRINEKEAQLTYLKELDKLCRIGVVALIN